MPQDAEHARAGRPRHRARSRGCDSGRQQATAGDGRRVQATKKAAEAASLAGNDVSSLDADARELVAELLDAATQAVDALLRSRVERMRLARGLELEQGQFAAVV